MAMSGNYIGVKIRNHKSKQLFRGNVKFDRKIWPALENLTWQT